MRNLISNDRTRGHLATGDRAHRFAGVQGVQGELQQAIDTALSNRPELEQLSLKMQQNDVSYAMYNDRSKWQVDLVGQFGSVGVAGPQTIVSGIPTIPARPGRRSVALLQRPVHARASSTGLRDSTSRFLFGTRRLDSQLAQVKVQNRQMMMNRRVTEQQIQTDIRNAVQAIETNKKRVDTARIARELAQEQLTGEEKRFQAGLSENFRVLDRQRGLSQAQGVELQSLIAYQQSIITLQKNDVYAAGSQ